MKVLEWVIAIALVVIGLSCLTMSANMFGENSDSIGRYLNTLLQVCFWAGIPVIVATLVYFLFIKKEGKRKN